MLWGGLCPTSGWTIAWENRIENLFIVALFCCLFVVDFIRQVVYARPFRSICCVVDIDSGWRLHFVLLLHILSLFFPPPFYIPYLSLSLSLSLSFYSSLSLTNNLSPFLHYFFCHMLEKLVPNYYRWAVVNIAISFYCNGRSVRHRPHKYISIERAFCRYS